MFTVYFVYEFIPLHFGIQLSAMSCNAFVRKISLGPTQPPVQLVRVALQPGHEADHSPPSSAEAKNV
jgi:hypothetical protein